MCDLSIFPAEHYVTGYVVKDARKVFGLTLFQKMK